MNIKKAARIYFTALKNCFASRMAYRTDFFFCLFITFISELIFPLVILLIYGAGASLPGWSVYEVLLLQGIFMLSRSTAGLLFFGVISTTLGGVREGTFDLLLIKPCSTLFLAVASNFNPDSIGSVLTAFIIIAYSLKGLEPVGLLAFAQFAFLFLLSMAVLFSFALIMSATMFKWVGNSRIYEIFESIISFGNYPATIYTKVFRNIITYIIPVAVLGFLPASALLGKETDGILPCTLACFSFLVAGVSFWKFMLSRYTSAGG